MEKSIGITWTEVIIVVVILGIMAAIAIPHIRGTDRCSRAISLAETRQDSLLVFSNCGYRR